jgi:hypothetical protein
MDPSDWATTVVALVGMGLSTLVALLTIRRQDNAHQAEQARFQEAQLAHERNRVDSIDRDHYVRLWEARKASYCALAAWLVEFRENIRAYEPDGHWSPTPPLESGTVGQIVVYGDYEVYARSESLRGGFAQTMENVVSLGPMIPDGYVAAQLTQYSDDAFRILMTVREEALTLPDWGEPIPLRPERTSAIPPGSIA